MDGDEDFEWGPPGRGGGGWGGHGGPPWGPGGGGPPWGPGGPGGGGGGGGPWGRRGRRGGPRGGGHRPVPPPWVHEVVRQFGGPDLADEFVGRPRRPRRARARRGDVRAAILDVLAGDEMNGYQLIQQISERSDGAWKPSPGSVYPTIQQLEDEGLVEGRDVESRRVLRLTDAGRSYVEKHPDEMAATWAPFAAADAADADEDERRWSAWNRPNDDLMPVASQVMSAMWQIVTTGTAQQRAEATEILVGARRKLYNLLAEGEPGSSGDDEESD